MEAIKLDHSDFIDPQTLNLGVFAPNPEIVSILSEVVKSYIPRMLGYAPAPFPIEEFNAQAVPTEDVFNGATWGEAAVSMVEEFNKTGATEKVLKIGNYIDCVNALYYPSGSIMGWHHNNNVPGVADHYAFSPKGGTVFRYIDPITKEQIDITESAGWSAKKTYFHPQYTTWHTVYTAAPRFCFAFRETNH
ncbi:MULTISPECIES: hypothetical protein [unclassified Pseudovibrio]|uniref:hypothetical protein n=1 Tax=unclassified Pseudovibrio TaxID=2627060 RepID=UPI0007AEE325|nr:MULTISPECIES: hypothetical protein [unclassified Pseudovibrio]KZK92578.1 hypothetical protein PsW74_05505 [Pseudovibrio sp. W74]KZL10378.1 hypothetical protein PsAD14_01285 [Pseudovibrio sp. Ad14]